MFQNWEFLIFEIWGHLAAAVGLTLILSWAIWGMRARSERTAMVGLRDDLERAKQMLDAKDSDLAQAFQKQEQLKDRMSGFQEKLEDAIAAKKTLEENAAKDQAKLAQAMQGRATAEKELVQAREELARAGDLSTSLSDAEPREESSVSAHLGKLKQNVKTASTWTTESLASLFGKSR